MGYDWTQSLQNSFDALWLEVAATAPQIVAAILILIIGWVIGGSMKTITRRVFAKLNVDKALDAAGVDTVAEKAGYKLNSGMFVGTLVKWFIIVVFFVAALDVLNLQQATVFLSQFILTYIPLVIVSVLILMGGIVLSNVVSHAVKAAGKATSFASSDFLAKFARYSILAFAILAALNQLNIAPELIQLLFAGMVFGMSLAFGLAFGLGGKEAAARYLNEMTRKGE